MRRDPRYLNVNEHTKICGEHFVIEDHLNPYSVKKRLKDGAVPSIFAWNKDKNQSNKRRSVMEKLEAIRTEEDEEADTAYEAEGDPATNSSEKDQGLVSRKTQKSEDDMCTSSDDHWRIPCSHKFSAAHLLSKCTTPKKEEKLFTHFTGFNFHGESMNTLQFLLQNLDRKLLIYWDNEARKSTVIDTETTFDGDYDDPDDFNDEEQNYISLTPPAAHKLPVEDKYLLVLMKLRTGVSVVDLGERLNIAESTVNNIFLTWINYLYVTLGSIKIWPHRDIILQNAPVEFLEKYPNKIAIIDATELMIEVLSGLQKHSECYSTYKSHTDQYLFLGNRARNR